MNTTASKPDPRMWVSFATFNHATKAQALLHLLQIEDIAARIEDERSLQKFWFFSRPRAGLHVQVQEDAFEAAQRYVTTNPDGRAAFKAAIHCPACNSSRVQYPAMTRKNILPTLVAQLLVLLRITHHEYYCEDCHNTWERSNGARARSHRGVAKAVKS